jgi:tripartite-type tricarboxylate transporter receptor subunit TctC
MFKHLLTIVFLFGVNASLAQDEFPSKPIKLVVPFAPGGASDAIARPLAQALSTILKQAVVVENKPGAAGNIGLEFVARSSADGYTLLLGNNSTNAMNQTSYASVLKFIPTKELTAVGVVGLTPSVLVASNNFPPKNANEFISYAKANTGKVNYWLPGVASGPHFDMVQLEKFLGIRMTAIPFSGGAGPGIAALVGGQVDIGLINVGGATPLVKSGRLKALAVSTTSRLTDLPDVPTAAEAGFGSLTSSWQVIFVPSSTPKPVIQKIHTALNEALSRSDVKESLTRAGTQISPSKSPDEAQTWVINETAKWAKIIIESGLKPE